MRLKCYTLDRCGLAFAVRTLCMEHKLHDKRGIIVDKHVNGSRQVLIDGHGRVEISRIGRLAGGSDIDIVLSSISTNYQSERQALFFGGCGVLTVSRQEIITTFSSTIDADSFFVKQRHLLPSSLAKVTEAFDIDLDLGDSKQELRWMDFYMRMAQLVSQEGPNTFLGWKDLNRVTSLDFNELRVVHGNITIVGTDVFRHTNSIVFQQLREVHGSIHLEGHIPNLDFANLRIVHGSLYIDKTGDTHRNFLFPKLQTVKGTIGLRTYRNPSITNGSKQLFPDLEHAGSIISPYMDIEVPKLREVSLSLELHHRGQSIEFLALQHIGKSFSLCSPGIQSLSMPQLESFPSDYFAINRGEDKAGHHFYVKSKSLKTLSLPKVQNVRDVFIAVNRMASLDIRGLQQAEKIHVRGKAIERIYMGRLLQNFQGTKQESEYLTLADFEDLSKRSTSREIRFEILPQQQNFQIAQGKSVPGDLEIIKRELTELSLPDLEEVGGKLLIDCPKLEFIDLSNLRIVRGSLTIASKSIYFKSLSLPSLRDVSGGIQITSGSSNSCLTLFQNEIYVDSQSLETLEFPSLIASHDVHIMSPSLKNVSFQKLELVSGMMSIGFERMHRLNLQSLHTICEKLHLHGQDINSINIPGHRHGKPRSVSLGTIATWAGSLDVFTANIGVSVADVSITLKHVPSGVSESNLGFVFQPTDRIPNGSVHHFSSGASNTVEHHVSTRDFNAAVHRLATHPNPAEVLQKIHDENRMTTERAGVTFTQEESSWVFGTSKGRHFVGQVQRYIIGDTFASYTYEVDVLGSEGPPLYMKPEQLYAVPMHQHAMLCTASSKFEAFNGQVGEIINFDGIKFTVQFSEGISADAPPEDLIFTQSAVFFRTSDNDSHHVGKVKSFGPGNNIIVQPAEGERNLSVDHKQIQKASPYKHPLIDEPADLKKPLLKVNEQDSQGRTLLHHAAMDDELSDVTIHLLSAGASFDIFDNSGKTPLHYSAMSAPSNTRILLQFGDDPARESSVTAWQYAAQMNRKDIFEQLYWQICELDNRERRFVEWDILLDAAWNTSRQSMAVHVVEQHQNLVLHGSDGHYSLHYEKCPKLYEHLKHIIYHTRLVELRSNASTIKTSKKKAEECFDGKFPDLKASEIGNAVDCFSQAMHKRDDETIFSGKTQFDLHGIHKALSCMAYKEITMSELCKDLNMPDLSARVVQQAAKLAKQELGTSPKRMDLDVFLSAQPGGEESSVPPQDASKSSSSSAQRPTIDVTPASQSSRSGNDQESASQAQGGPYLRVCVTNMRDEPKEAAQGSVQDDKTLIQDRFVEMVREACGQVSTAAGPQ